MSRVPSQTLFLNKIHDREYCQKVNNNCMRVRRVVLNNQYTDIPRELTYFGAYKHCIQLLEIA